MWWVTLQVVHDTLTKVVNESYRQITLQTYRHVDVCSSFTNHLHHFVVFQTDGVQQDMLQVRSLKKSRKITFLLFILLPLCINQVNGYNTYFNKITHGSKMSVFFLLETKKVVFALAFAIGCTQECVNCQRQ
jgi:hypothetical protein